MQADFFYRVEKAISPARLGAYRTNGTDDLDVICRYLWNLSLCESLYPSLHALEVVLRNGLHNALHFHHGAS